LSEKMPKPKIMITGSEGFIGRHLVEHLSKNKDFEILKFDIRLNVFQDVREERFVMQFMEKNRPDIIIHLAANPDIPTSVENPKQDLVLNTAGTINMLEAAKKYNAKLFIFASTAQVYGEPKQMQMGENHPLNPKSPYAIGKLVAEGYINFYHQKYGVPTVIFRFFNVYGEGQPNWAVIPILIERMAAAKGKFFEMYGSKEDSRDFIYVKDLCAAFEKAIEKKPVGETINLGAGKETYILDLAKTIASVLGKDFEYKYLEKVDKAKITRMAANVEKAKKLLGWEAKVSVKEGVTNVIKSKGLL